MQRTLSTLIIALFCLFQGIYANGQSRPQLTVLYDNYPFNSDLVTGDGFSCMLSGIGKNILFDTGGKGDVLLSNMKALDLDPEIFDLIVISHEHKDHTNGLLPVLETNKKAVVYIPDGFSDFALLQQIEARGNKMVVVREATQICSGVFSTGPMRGQGLFEQSLILNTKSGLVLICGCSHPGVTNIIEKSMQLFRKRMLFVFGGFHMSSSSEQSINDVINKFLSLGVTGVGGSHCTGTKMMQMLKAAYGKNYIQMGVGRTITLR